MIIITGQACKVHHGIARKSATSPADSVVVAPKDTVKPVAVRIDTPKPLPPVVDSATIWLGMVQPIWKNSLVFNTFGAKAKVHYESGDNSQDFTASFRVRKDSCIWVTITALGGMVQAARVLITPDSVFMINYLDKEISALPLSDVAKVLPVQVDFTSLQNLILGQPPRNGRIDKVNREVRYRLPAAHQLQYSGLLPGPFADQNKERGWPHRYY
jgi:Domain of unknown function (DUF4292)